MSNSSVASVVFFLCFGGFCSEAALYETDVPLLQRLHSPCIERHFGGDNNGNFRYWNKPKNDIVILEKQGLFLTIQIPHDNEDFEGVSIITLMIWRKIRHESTYVSKAHISYNYVCDQGAVLFHHPQEHQCASTFGAKDVVRSEYSCSYSFGPKFVHITKYLHVKEDRVFLVKIKTHYDELRHVPVEVCERFDDGYEATRLSSVFSFPGLAIRPYATNNLGPNAL